MTASVIARGAEVRFELPHIGARSLKRTLMSPLLGGAIKNSNSGQEVRALTNVTFELSAGDRVALIGRNGAGKTTLLRMIAGTYFPTAGSIDVTGRILPLLDLAGGFDDEATGFENVHLRGLFMGWAPEVMEERCKYVERFSGLGDYLYLPVRTYSNGMMVRLLFSIATSAPADIVVMDEWIAAGDSEFVERANARLREIVAESGIVVLASHNAALLGGLCNRGLVLDQGQILFDGNIVKAIETSQNLLVRSRSDQTKT